jgi:subtilisin-like proprotein convertase family protein
MYKKITLYFSLVFCLTVSASRAQQKSDWTSIAESSKRQISNVTFDKNKMPTVFNLYTLNIESIKSKLQNAPIRGAFLGKSPNIVSVPNADGTAEDYRVYDTQILHPTLAAKLPNIKSYVGRSINNSGKFIRFSVSQIGFHGQVFEPGKSTYFIDPYTNDKSVYIAYKREDLVNNSGDVFSCETDNKMYEKAKNAPSNRRIQATDDSIIRLYELAMSCTGEYGALFIGDATTDFDKKSNILAQMAVTMTRVNGVYEKELGITFQFVPEIFKIIYYDGATDPWTAEYNDATQAEIDDKIGDANYDIGHNFNTDGGGNAGCIGCVCNSGNKGSGMTGRRDPTGDSFDVDYVAHEIGHQMGGYHTHNGTATCLKSGSNTEVEPGSGSSIMGYAGICEGQNVQDNSDDYFNYVNIRDISLNIQQGVSSSCFDTIVVGNLAPTANAGADYIIPTGTAFVLTGAGTDPDSKDVLTYTWEQNDNEDMQTPLLPIPQSTAGPMFRSRAGTIVPSRYFPQLSDILDNNLWPTWEVIPDSTRNFEFALTVRDNVIYGGQTADDLMQLRSDASAGPFVVTSQNNNTTWIQGNTETITWDVAGTDNVATVNCQNVTILFSAKGDFTDTITLRSSTLNDGSEDISVPSSVTTTGKLMIKAADNVFLDVNNAIIIIEEVLVPTFFLTAFEFEKTECTNVGTETFKFDYSASAGQLGEVLFSATGNPEGSTISFSPESVNTIDRQTITMTVSNLASVTPQEYIISIAGKSTTETKSFDVTLTLKGTNFEVPILSNPVDNSTNQSTFPRYIWSADTSGVSESYVIEIATEANFSTIIETAKTITNSYNQIKGLAEDTSYFWRIRPANECGDGTFTSESIFSTGKIECFTKEDTTLTPIILELTTSTTINITEDIPLSDINVTVSIAHPFIGDVVIELVSPSGTKVTLIAGQCGDNDNMEATFDDLGEAMITCVPTTDLVTFSPAIEGTFKPKEPLSAFNGESSVGTWTLNLTDTGLGDDGALTSWTIEYCGVTERTLATKSFNDLDIIMFPNPATDILSIQFDDTSELKVTLFDLLGRKVISKVLDSNNSDIDVSTLASGTYIVQMQNENNEKISKNLIIE